MSLTDEMSGYAVFLYPQALAMLGEAIKPYLRDDERGPHLVCSAIDTGGALIEMTLEGRTDTGETVSVEVMIPVNMVRMIVSARSDAAFGFGPRIPVESVAALPPQPLASATPGTADVVEPVKGEGTAAKAGAVAEAKLPPEG